VVVALLIGILAVFFASPSPDGLESVAEELGFLGSAQGPAYEVIPDYVTPGLANETAAAVLAIMLGTLLLFGVGFAVARLLRRRSQRLTEVPATVPASSTQQQ
jgi:hypothetical protein